VVPAYLIAANEYVSGSMGSPRTHREGWRRGERAKVRALDNRSGLARRWRVQGVVIGRSSSVSRRLARWCQTHDGVEGESV
jgi:hypothetical protein